MIAASSTPEGRLTINGRRKWEGNHKTYSLKEEEAVIRVGSLRYGKRRLIMIAASSTAEGADSLTMGGESERDDKTYSSIKEHLSLTDDAAVIV